MEDAATAEISRTQVWQWIHNPRGVLHDGRKVTVQLVREVIQQELLRIEKERGTARFKDGKFKEATALFDRMIASDTLDDFLTLQAYENLGESV
jgi:malate synthase